MPKINASHPEKWNEDTATSVCMYNDWFLEFAPRAYILARESCMREINRLFSVTNNLTRIDSSIVEQHPTLIKTLRMMCAPPIARDRLAGLAQIPSNFLKALEEGKVPKNYHFHAHKFFSVLEKLRDNHLFSWVRSNVQPDAKQLQLANAVIADRVTGATADPIIRNEQEKRQLNKIKLFLEEKGYTQVQNMSLSISEMPNGSFLFRKNVPVFKNGNDEQEGWINTPIDVVIKRKEGNYRLPLFVECKSAGDYTNTNKRRKEEAAKVAKLQATYGQDMTLCLFLCGYFDAGYLGYEAANCMDWVWEHRIEDFNLMGV